VQPVEQREAVMRDGPLKNDGAHYVPVWAATARVPPRSWIRPVVVDGERTAGLSTSP
jgi:hypothetical protein